MSVLGARGPDEPSWYRCGNSAFQDVGKPSFLEAEKVSAFAKIRWSTATSRGCCVQVAADWPRDGGFYRDSSRDPLHPCAGLPGSAVVSLRPALSTHPDHRDAGSETVPGRRRSDPGRDQERLIANSCRSLLLPKRSTAAAQLRREQRRAMERRYHTAGRNTQNLRAGSSNWRCHRRGPASPSLARRLVLGAFCRLNEKDRAMMPGRRRNAS